MTVNLVRLGKTVEKYMLDTVLIQRPAAPVINPVSLAATTALTTVYTGKAFVSPMGDPELTNLGSRAIYRTQYEIGIPHGVADVKANDLVTVTASRAEFDRPLTVHESIDGTFHTHHRIKAWLDVEAT